MVEPNRPKAIDAGIIVRMAAAMYDGLILFGVGFLVFIPVTVAEKYLGDAPVWLKSILFMTTAYAYFAGFWVRGGATTGMRRRISACSAASRTASSTASPCGRSARTRPQGSTMAEWPNVSRPRG